MGKALSGGELGVSLKPIYYPPFLAGRGTQGMVER